MHTYTSKNTTTFHYNSDFSGDVHILTPTRDQQLDQRIEVSGEAILEFVAFCYVQAEKISRIEEMNKEELLLQS